MTRRVETIKILKSELRKLLETTRELDSKLTAHEPEKLSSSTPEEDLIVVGYYLSGLYSNLEDMFEKVTRQFENKIEDTTQRQNRMALEIENIVRRCFPKHLSKHWMSCAASDMSSDFLMPLNWTGRKYF